MTWNDSQVDWEVNLTENVKKLYFDSNNLNISKIVLIKVGLSPSKIIFFIYFSASPSKKMKNVFISS